MTNRLLVQHDVWRILLLLAAVGCERTECPEVGPLEDARFPSLCISDELLVSPRKGLLTPGTPDAGVSMPVPAPTTGDAGPVSDAGIEASSAVNASARLQMSVMGTDEAGQPREAAHVEIQLEGDTGVARLIGSPLCARRTDDRLHCQLDVDGLARFELEHAGDGDGVLGVCALSGSLKNCASVTVQSANRIQLELAANPVVLSAFAGLEQPPTVSCANELAGLPALTCWDALRRVPITAKLVTEGMAAPAVDGGDGGRPAVPATAPVTGKLILGGSDWSDAFLSVARSCDPSTAMGQVLDLRFATGVSELLLALCVSRAGGNFHLEGTLQTPGAATFSLDVTARAAPAAVLPTGSSAAGVDGDEATLFRCDRSALVDSGVTTRVTTETDVTRITLTDADSGQQATCSIMTMVAP
jgi:hypothetical protein